METNIEPSSHDPAEADPEAGKIYRGAAKFCWMSLIAMAISMSVFNSIGLPLLGDFISLALILAGLAAGCFALVGIPRHGPKGILIPALIGLTLQVLMVFIFVTNFIEARGRVREQINQRR